MIDPNFEEACKNETLEHYDKVYTSDPNIPLHLLSMLASELIFEFVSEWNLPFFDKLPKMFQDVLTHETAKNLSYTGAQYRTEVSEFSWMNQLTNPKDATIHGPDFVVNELSANTSFAGTAKVTDPTFDAYLDPGKSIISVKFAGRLYGTFWRLFLFGFHCFSAISDVLQFQTFNLKQLN